MAKVTVMDWVRDLPSVALRFAKLPEKDAAGKDSRQKAAGRRQGESLEKRRRAQARLPDREPDNLSRRFLIERLSKLESSRQ
jgi:hypothetical protein